MNVLLKPSRRDLLKGTGALIVAFSLSSRSEALAQAETDVGKPLTLDQVDTFAGGHLCLGSLRSR